MLVLTSQDVKELNDKTAGDECEICVKGIIRGVSNNNGINTYNIEILEAEYSEDSNEYDGDMKRAFKKAMYVRPDSKPTGV